MATSLKPVLSALNLQERSEQVAFVQLLQASGALGKLPGINTIASEQQAGAILDNLSFESRDKAFDWLHAVTQQHFLRSPANAERVHVQEPAFAKEHRNEILPLLAKTGVTSGKSPVARHFDHALVLGAMEGSVDARLDQLKLQWDNGVRVDKIYLLGSDRPLIAEHENVHAGAKTEMDMFLARYKEKSASWPAELQNIPVFAVNTPNRADGSRANTQDTIKRWVSAGVQPGSVLAISNQPYANYQDAAVRSALPAGFTLETAGAPAKTEDIKIINALDTFAREIDVGAAQIKARMNEQATRTEHLEQVTMVDPVKLKVDAGRFQFRRQIDAVTGVTKKGKKSGGYNPMLDGDMLLLWEDKSGERFVVDGHHRTQHLKELRARGEGPANVPARILRESDGYTAQDAKIVGAYKNFVQDHDVNLLDAATVFHEVQSGKVHFDLLPRLKLEGNLKLSYQASTLSEPAFAMVERGEVPVEAAAHVALNVKGEKEQLGVMNIIKSKLADPAQSWQARLKAEKSTPPGITL